MELKLNKKILKMANITVTYINEYSCIVNKFIAVVGM